MRRFVPIACWCLALVSAPRLTRAQRVPAVTVHVDSVTVQWGRTLALSGDTLRWFFPGANFLHRPGSRPATIDTLVLLFAVDTVYEIDGRARTPAPAFLARHYRQLREMAEMDRWLEQMGLQPERK